MSSDIVDFSPMTTRRPAPSLSLPLAVLGCALGAASMLGDWQTVRLPAEVAGPQAQEFHNPIITAGPLASAYLVVLFLAVAAVTLALFGDERVRPTARLTGIVFAGCGLVLLGATGRLLADGLPTPGGIFYSELPDNATIGVQWGFFAALGAMFALGAAAGLSRPAAKPVPLEAEEEAEFADDAIELSVTVEPLTKRGR